MKIRLLAAIAAFGVASACAGANTWFVATNGVDKTIDEGGGTETAPFRTLQFAHDQATKGDTVKLFPGVYDEGVTYSTGSNRLTVAKKLYFRSVSGKASDTIVLGAKDPDTIDTDKVLGVGPKAVRCLRLDSGAANSEFHHITFRGGATRAKTETTDSTFTSTMEYNGGCISSAVAAYFVDCVIEEGASAIVGGGIVGPSSASSYPVLIRCRVDNCIGDSWGASIAHAKLWCSVVANSRNKSTSRPAIGYATLVNCSISYVNQTGVDKACTLYNTVVNQNQGAVAGSNSPSTLYNTYSKTNLVDGVSSFDRAFLAPAVKDYRLCAGTKAVNGGLTKYLTKITLPTGVEMTDFNGNPFDTESPTCHAGAVQEVATPVGGRLVAPAGSRIDGHSNQFAAYVYAEQWPTAYRLAGATDAFTRFSHGGDYNGHVGAYFYADNSGSAVVWTPPPTRPDDTYSPTAVSYENYLWCDASADAATADGTEEHPFTTLQAAVDEAADKGISPVVIQVKPGDYRTGGGVIRGHNCRVAVPTGLIALIRSTEGAAVTFITGAADENPQNVDYPGCGSSAVRCAGFEANESNYLLLQGFTLRDGYTACTDPSAPDECDKGGAVYGSSATRLQVVDCVISNCHGVVSAVGTAAHFNRCRFVDCTSKGTLFSTVNFVSSYIAPSCTSGDGAEFGTNSRLHFTTAPGARFGNTADCRAIGSLLGVGALPAALPENVGSFEEPHYVNVAAGDVRLMSTTPVVGAYQGLDDDAQLRLQDIYFTNVRVDVDGNGYRTVEGTSVPFPGGIQGELVNGAYVPVAVQGGYAVTDGAIGRGYLADELPITLEATTDASRPLIGFVYNGVTNRLDKTTSVTVAAEDLAQAGGKLFVAPCYTSDWYVDPAGSDANSGFFPDEARATLAAALADERLQPGDTVHAAAGRYENEVMTVDEKRFRAAVPEGVALVGAGVGETIVVGAKDESDQADANGFGPNAVRGVRLASNASVKGLTITGCWTEAGGQGGGIVASSYGSSPSDRSDYVASDCFITNCWAAVNGGGACGVRLVRCKFIDNHSVNTGGSTYLCELYGVITDWSYQGDDNTSSANAYFRKVVYSTIGKNNTRFSGSGSSAAIGNAKSIGSTSVLASTIILGNARVIHQATNCVYTSAMSGYTAAFATSRKATVDEIALDADYRPILGTSVAIDYGDNALYEEARAILGETDILGTQRIYNGAIDVGAVEADWRGTYAADILGRKFAVGTADAQVRESDPDKTVLVPAGASLSGTLLGKAGGETPYLMKFVVPEGGSLTVTAGEASTTYGEGTHEVEVAAVGESTPVTFASMAGTAEILRGKCLAGTVLLVK